MRHFYAMQPLIVIDMYFLSYKDVNNTFLSKVCKKNIVFITIVIEY